MLLNRLKDFLASRVAPYANQLDADAKLLKTRFIELGEQGLLAVKVAERFNGFAADRALTHDYFAMIASSSYALAFLVAQHESCASLLQKGSNEAVKADLLTQMIQGQFRAGVGIYHLRHHAKRPMITAKKVAGGYRVSGRLDWVSGFEIFDHIALGFIVDEGKGSREVIGLVPFRAQSMNLGADMIEVGAVQEVTAVSATNTVAIQFNNWLIDEKDIIVDHEGSVIQQRSVLSITHATMLMGIFQAALNIISDSGQITNQDAVVLNQFKKFSNQHEQLRNELLNTSTREQVQHVRAKIHAQTRDCVYLAAALSGGRAVLADHSVQRLNRELLQATVAGVNPLFIHSLCASTTE
ncbi:acyl-CoA dehydrogenase family protein [Piscirickettsia litoralis]|uniref:Acyl-CoA dehydrogenase/oxidase N-terminal domain-containing protein n=1 Tax=Piscirickettsia litoralis TaxID=1891921 RepID=A0ABX3A379_9GAMM|nr:acyl-CoA dehydrogenase family protein [Piscirickettsia litoralis]ODN43332.1 hypothetical protein BGC07_10860 [Piscirickettsia litoralis]